MKGYHLRCLKLLMFLCIIYCFQISVMFLSQEVVIPANITRIETINSQQLIINLNKLGSVDNDTVIVVVQVHRKFDHLKQLISSLSLAKEIEKTLLIFSHDYWDLQINELLESIDFVKYMQIFYPYSIQIYQDKFPGHSSDDCPREATTDEAEALECANKDWPDQFGHYREAKFTQLKHHFWWKANRIFDQLDVTTHHTEEDYYVMEDFLYVLNLLNKERMLHHQDVEMIGLGKSSNFPPHEKIEFRIWPKGPYYSNKLWVTNSTFSHNNIGIAFTRDLWIKLKACSIDFCTFDDYNYDWSLYKIAVSCLREKLQVLLLMDQRVIHTGLCGFHQREDNCDITEVNTKIKHILRKARHSLFPRNISVQNVPKEDKVPKGYGGFADLRDQLLCQRMAMPVQSLVDVEAVLNDIRGLTNKKDRDKKELKH